MVLDLANTQFVRPKPKSQPKRQTALPSTPAVRRRAPAENTVEVAAKRLRRESESHGGLCFNHQLMANFSNEFLHYLQTQILPFNLEDMNEVKCLAIKAELNRYQPEIMAIISTLRQQPIVRYSNQPVERRFLPEVAKQMLTQYKPVKVPADGSCFYHSVSQNLFGTIQFSGALRLALLWEFLENMRKIEYVSDEVYGFGYTSIFHRVGEIIRTPHWCPQLGMWIMSKVLERPIHIYANFSEAEMRALSAEELKIIFDTTQAGVHHNMYRFSESYKLKQPICLHFYSAGEPFYQNRNHFAAYLPIVPNPVIFTPVSIEYRRFTDFANVRV